MKPIRYVIAVLAAACSLASCDKYLDMKPIDPLTRPEDVFSKRATTEQYLYGLYGRLPKEWRNGANSADDGGLPWVPCSDEADVVFKNDFQSINNGAWNPSTMNYCYDQWERHYQAIHECNYFMQNVNMCGELSEDEKLQYHTEARFLRAYFYFLMIRVYGPVCLVGDAVVDANDTYNIGRSPYDSCVNYVVRELDAVSRILPPVQNDIWLGKPTQGAALAVKSRLLLYAASKLFNNDNSLYKDFKSKTTGENLFPTAYSEQKWRDAAQAAFDVIELNRYSLVEKTRQITEGDVTSEEIDPYASLSGIFADRWNSEIIFGRLMNDMSYYQRCSPRALTNCWGGFGATQSQVDAYAMASGRYPITGYADDGKTPIIDPEAGYTETGTTNFVHPYDGFSMETYNMYVGREPRFYMDITWDNMRFPYSVPTSGVADANKSVVAQFYYNASSGPGTSHNYSVSGYLVRKGISRQNDPQNGIWTLPLSWPMFRLAEIYLNYVEALIECDPSNPDILIYWNKVRHRAGVPNIETAYPEAIGDQGQMRELIRRERRIELAFESHRFFDTRRWQIGEQTLGGYMYGMNVMALTDQPIGVSEFWQRTPTANGKRVFEKKHYLFPIWQRHMDRDNLIEQSPFWK